MTKDDKPIVNPYVQLREEFDDWAILFNPDTGRGFGLNPTGVYVWKLLDGAHTVDGNVERINAPEAENPYWEIELKDGTILMATGSVSVHYKTDA